MRFERLRDLLLENWGLKIVSLLLAVFLWMFVVADEKSSIHLDVPLALDNMPGQLVVVSPIPRAVAVRVEGPRNILADLKSDDLSVRIDLKGMQAGVSHYEITPSRFDLPRAVEVMDISPRTVTLVADPAVTKRVPVHPVLRGTPAEGYEVAAVRVSPTDVEVTGSEKILKPVSALQTEEIDLTGLDRSVAKTVDLVLPGLGTRAAGKGTARVEVTVREKVEEREFRNIPVRPPEEGLKAHPAAVTVRLKGRASTLSDLSTADIAVVVGPGIGVEPGVPAALAAEVPYGIDVEAIRPAKVVFEPAR